LFSRKRSDTLVSTIEREYGLDLHVRADMLLGNLLDQRGFDSLTQLLAAYRGKLTEHARKRRVFLSFHYEDIRQINGFRLMLQNPHVELELFDGSVREPINSQNKSYVRAQIREKINRASVLMCLIGNGTAWRDFVDWEIATAAELGKGVCGVRLKNSRGRTPPLLKKLNAPIAGWNPQEIVQVIECAAARRT
jgi:hypothetical protein